MKLLSHNKYHVGLNINDAVYYFNKPFWWDYDVREYSKDNWQKFGFIRKIETNIQKL